MSLSLQKVVNDQSNKTTVAKVGHNNQSDLKDTNFEYEDNEWDDVGKCHQPAS